MLEAFQPNALRRATWALALTLVAPLWGCVGPGHALPKWESLRMTSLVTGTEASLRGIAAWDAQVIWASGSAGTYLHTTDGGESWTVGQIPGLEQRDLRDIHLFGPRRALVLVVGSPAELWLTNDAGLHWELIHRLEHPDAFMDSMDFWPNGQGLCFGDPIEGAFTLWRSDHSGRNWSGLPAESLPAPRDKEAGFAASGTLVRCLAGGRAMIATGGGAARVLVTQDYGDTWSAYETPMAQGGAATGSFSLGLGMGSQALLVGGDYTDPERRTGSAAYSSDAGRTWRPSAEPQPGYRSCIQALPGCAPGTWLAVGKGGASLTDDGGVHWRDLNLDGHYCMAFAPSMGPAGCTAFLAGANGRMSRLEIPCVR